MTDPSAPPGETRRTEAHVITRAIERATGYDSMDTIESIYVNEDGKTYDCVFPGCRFASGNSFQMWLHVHGLRERDKKHPCSWIPRSDRG